MFSHWKKHQPRWCVSSLFLFIVFLSCSVKAASVSRTCFILETTHGKQNMRVCRQRQKNAYGIYLKCSLALDPILCKYLAESHREQMRQWEKLKAQQTDRWKEIKTWHFPQRQTSADYKVCLPLPLTRSLTAIVRWKVTALVRRPTNHRVAFNSFNEQRREEEQKGQSLVFPFHLSVRISYTQSEHPWLKPLNGHFKVWLAAALFHSRYIKK